MVFLCTIDTFRHVWYHLDMLKTHTTSQAYTPEQVADILQLSKNTVYDLIGRGEIIAKKIGKQYRIPMSSLSFFSTGLDDDLYRADQVDRKTLQMTEAEVAQVRSQL